MTRFSSRGNFALNAVHRSASEISSKSSVNDQMECFSISSRIHISSLLQIIPLDSIPLIFLGSIVIPAFSNTVPGKATGTYNQVATLDPPQMIWYIHFFPQSTIQTFSLSASGCCSQDFTNPTTILSAIDL